MGKFKGTKGKWEVTDKSVSRISINEGSIEIWFGTDFNGYPTEKEAKYNALLISKAPEMLKLFESLVIDHGTIPSAYKDKIQKLIKEATEL